MSKSTWVGNNAAALPARGRSPTQQLRGQSTVQAMHASYVSPRMNSQPIVIHATFTSDGEVTARQVIRVLDRTSRSSAQQGMTGMDSSETPFLSGGMVAL